MNSFKTHKKKINAFFTQKKNKSCLFLIAKVIDESNVSIYFCLIFSPNVIIPNEIGFKIGKEVQIT